LYSGLPAGGDRMAKDLSIGKLILVPSLITLGITLLRLWGELQHWAPAYFNPAAGGGGALVGIAWLVPVFGFYFGLKVSAEGERAGGAGPAIGWPLLGFLIMPAVGFAAIAMHVVAPATLPALGVFVVMSLVGAVLAIRGWAALGRVLLAYAL